jgi:YD repeat-containing protein
MLVISVQYLEDVVDAGGQFAAEIDPLGRRTEYEFDNRGNQVRVIYPDGSSETSEYDPEGNLVAETDRAGRTTRMVYDAAGRLIETILPDNTPDDDSDNPRRYSIYDGAGRLVEEVDERGNSTFYGYDDAGRNTKVTDALGNETVYEYDNRGQRTAMIDARGNRTEYVYDAAGRLLTTLHPNDTESSVSYDALGQKVAETDPAGRTTQFEYDAAGRLIAVIDALGQRTAHTDFKGQTVEFTYDVLSRPVETIYPDGSTVETRYAPNGQVWEIEVSCSPAPCSVEGKDVGVTVHQYDERDRLTRIDYPDGRWIEYDYDEAGNRTELRTANQRTRYAFDALNRLSTVTACANADCSSGDTTTYQYNEVGSRRLVQHANGTTTEYQYDSLNRLTLLTTWDAFGAVIHRQQFHLGAAGHREMLVEDSQRVVEYTYDALYRLVEEKVTNPRGDRTTAYTFDATGNRLTRLIHHPTYCGTARPRVWGVSLGRGSSPYR